jgi:hypothetical protein
VKPEQRSDEFLEDRRAPVTPMDVQQLVAQHGTLHIRWHPGKPRRKQNNRPPVAEGDGLQDLIVPAHVRSGRERAVQIEKVVPKFGALALPPQRSQPDESDNEPQCAHQDARCRDADHERTGGEH